MLRISKKGLRPIFWKRLMASWFLEGLVVGEQKERSRQYNVLEKRKNRILGFVWECKMRQSSLPESLLKSKMQHQWSLLTKGILLFITWPDKVRMVLREAA